MFRLKYRDQEILTKNIICVEGLKVMAGSNGFFFDDTGISGATLPQLYAGGYEYITSFGARYILKPFTGGPVSHSDLFASHASWAEFPSVDMFGSFPVTWLDGSGIGKIALTSTALFKPQIDLTIDGVFIYHEDAYLGPNGTGNRIRQPALIAASTLATPLAVNAGDTVLANYEIGLTINL